MRHFIFLILAISCFTIATQPGQAQQAQSAKLQKCEDDKKLCYNKCTERAIPGEGTEVSCQGECNRWYNACRGKGRGPVSRNKSGQQK